MITVTLYCAGQNDSCDLVKGLLGELRKDFPHQLVEIDITREQALQKALEKRIPVVQIGPYRLEGDITQDRLRVALGAAIDRNAQLEKVGDKVYRERIQRGKVISSGDRISLWLSSNYIHLFNALIFIYVGLPFLAPVLMHNGSAFAANLIYKFYSIMCHQLPFRSWFLYGEQAYYPRELAGLDVLSYESVVHQDHVDIILDRAFVGNDVVGYKVALCQRDIAMYGSMLIFGIGFALSGRRIKTIPWYVWVILGLGPIGLDGLSQLPGIVPGLPAWLPVRESTPLLRTITGTLFGVMTTWYLYPMIEATMKETRGIVMRKMATIEQLSAVEK